MNRERITISIKKDLLSKVDKKVDGVKLRNRSHAVESLLSEALGINAIKDAIVMAGGEEATKNIAAIKDAILRLRKVGIEEVIVAIGYLGDKIKKELGDGKNFDLKISYLEKGEGSGGAIFLLKKALKKTFLVVNVSESLEFDYKSLIDFHKSTNYSATIATSDIKNMTGVYVLDPEILPYLPKGFSMLEDDIFPRLLKENKLSIYPVLN